MRSISNNVVVYNTTDNGISAKLYGFRVNSAELVKDHRDWLFSYVLPILYDGGSITVMGEASRTGSAVHNKSLSQKRATAVVAYLRSLMTNSANSFGVTLSKDMTNKFGVGEIAALLSGQANGTEDKFYRAVVISAWNKKIPPPMPNKPLPGRPIKRVVKREFRKSDTGMPKGTNPFPDSGDDGVAIAEIIKGITDHKKRGGSDKRDYQMINSKYLVNRVDNVLTIDKHLVTGVVRTIIYTDSYTYTWGPPTKDIYIKMETIIIDKNNTKTVRPGSARHYDRSKAWKLVRTPYVS